MEYIKYFLNKNFFTFFNKATKETYEKKYDFDFK